MTGKAYVFAVALILAFSGYAVNSADNSQMNGSAPQNSGQGAGSAGDAARSDTHASQANKESGDIEVVKGKIDKWNDKGQIEAGGFLGLGDTNLQITKDTVIMSPDGKRMNRNELRVGREIASIYKEDNQKRAGGFAPAGVARDPYKIALVIVVK